jgi:hypothetical protein
MAGKRKTIKHCVECGDKISGIKDYCATCHASMLEKMKEVRRKKFRTDSA